MLINHCLRAAAVLLAANSLGPVRGEGPANHAPQPKETRTEAAKEDASVIEVKPGRFDVTILAGGFVEPVVSRALFCPVERPTRIVKLAANGAQVKKGDVVCALDSSDLRDEFIKRKAAIEKAGADYNEAQLGREVAEISVVEYTKGILKIDLVNIEGDIILTKSDLERSRDMSEFARGLHEEMNARLKQRGGLQTPENGRGNSE